MFDKTDCSRFFFMSKNSISVILISDRLKKDRKSALKKRTENVAASLRAYENNNNAVVD